jgi:hypothetical protein
MQKSLVATGFLLLSACFGSAQSTPTRVMIQGTPEQIKKVALAMFARSGYSMDSANTTQLKISKPFREEETTAYNTGHWTNQPVANCRHVQTLLLAADEGTAVTMAQGMVCHTDGLWLIRSEGDQKEIQRAQNILAGLKVKAEETNKRR